MELLETGNRNVPCTALPSGGFVLGASVKTWPVWACERKVSLRVYKCGLAGIGAFLKRIGALSLNSPRAEEDDMGSELELELGGPVPS